MKLRVAMLIAACALASSCQTMSKEECAVADWRVVGEQDGAAGYAPQDRFARHVKACTKAGIAADQTLWYQGYQQGLPRYCTPLNGLSVGSQGKSYANVCPADLDPAFREGYDLGRIYYEKKREISNLESRIRSLRRKSAPTRTWSATARPTAATSSAGSIPTAGRSATSSAMPAGSKATCAGSNPTWTISATRTAPDA